MLNWLKGLPTSHALGWIGIGLLAIVIVLVFVRRLVGMDGLEHFNEDNTCDRRLSICRGGRAI